MSPNRKPLSAQIEQAVADLPVVLRLRLATGASLRHIADESGVPLATAHRALQGKSLNVANLVALLRWAEGGR